MITRSEAKQIYNRLKKEKLLTRKAMELDVATTDEIETAANHCPYTRKMNEVIEEIRYLPEEAELHHFIDPMFKLLMQAMEACGPEGGSHQQYQVHQTIQKFLYLEG